MKDFIAGLTGTPEDKLNAVRLATRPIAVLVPANSMNSLLVQYGLSAALTKISVTDGHPAQDAMISFLDSKSNDYNFIIGTTAGDAAIANIDLLIAAGISVTLGSRVVDVSAGLAALKPTLLHICNREVDRFPNVTLADVRTVLNDDTRFTELFQARSGNASITVDRSLNPDFEAYAPQVFFKINGNYYRKAGMQLIDRDGVFDTDIPFARPNVEGVFVDNSYGVISSTAVGD